MTLLPRPLARVIAAAAFVVSPLLGDYPVRPVPFTDVHLTGGLWKERQDTVRQTTLPFALRQCEESGRLKNFDLAAEVMRRRAAGETSFQHKPASKYRFDDSDVFKAIEGAAYVLALQPDPALEKQIDGYAARIAAAQEPDGYLYSFRTMHPDKAVEKSMGEQRWIKESFGSHETYNLGHLYEAAIAYYQATGKRTLLDVSLRSAELLWKEFGSGKRVASPGHEEIELALVKLHRVSGDARWLKLAKIFIEARGRAEQRDPYCQAHKPALEQSEAVGHAVRAVYLYSGMADVAAMTNDPAYTKAISAIWEDVASRKLYLTGGIGARVKREAFGDAYELPNDGYNETCAAIGLMLWNHRMFLSTGDARYMDVFERTAFNGFISGGSIGGDLFFYPNPLVYDGQAKHNVGHAGRAPWFGCSCCPPNFVRMVSSFAGYFYAVRDDRVYVNLYGQSSAKCSVGGNVVKIEQTTGYPWDAKVKLVVSPEKPSRFTVLVRIPGWVRGQPVPSDLYAYDATTPADWTASVNGKNAAGTLEQGYLPITREWRPGDQVTLEFPLLPRRVRAHASVAADVGRVALERGPIVYCFEGLDNGGNALNLSLPDTASVKAEWQPALLGGVHTLVAETNGTRLTAIPYFLWNNRGLSSMQVWLTRQPAPQSER